MLAAAPGTRIILTANSYTEAAVVNGKSDLTIESVSGATVWSGGTELVTYQPGIYGSKPLTPLTLSGSDNIIIRGVRFAPVDASDWSFMYDFGAAGIGGATALALNDSTAYLVGSEAHGSDGGNSMRTYSPFGGCDGSGGGRGGDGIKSTNGGIAYAGLDCLFSGGSGGNSYNGPGASSGAPVSGSFNWAEIDLPVQPTPTLTATPSFTLSPTPSPIPSLTLTQTPTLTPTASRTPTFTPSPTPSRTVSPSYTPCITDGQPPYQISCFPATTAYVGETFTVSLGIGCPSNPCGGCDPTLFGFDHSANLDGPSSGLSPAPPVNLTYEALTDAQGDGTISGFAQHAFGNGGNSVSCPVTILPERTPTGTASLPFSEGFESGATLADYWLANGAYDYRTQTTTSGAPHAGARHLTMDDAGPDGNPSNNRLTLRIDLAGRVGATLRFWAKGFSDEPDAPPALPYYGAAHYDGVAISADGKNWKAVQPLTALASDWAQFTLDLGAATAEAGMPFNSSFFIRFTQQGAASIPNDGIAIDDIEIFEGTPTPTPTPSVSPTPAPPSIVRQPASLIVNAGQPAAFSVEAAGDAPLAYAWKKGAGPAPGVANAADYSIASATAADAGSYLCSVSNVGGSVDSDAATLTVIEPPAANGAEYVFNSAPAEIEPGEIVYIGIVMKNTSPLTWSGAQGYALAVIDDPDGLFQGVTRLYPASAPWTVSPVNGLAQFVASIRAPLAPGAHTAQVRMVEENVEFFGEIWTLTIATVAPPNRASDWETYE